MKKAMEIKPICGMRLKNCRQKKKITLKKLSGMVDFSVTILTKIENGRSPLTPQIAIACANALNVRKEYLLDEDNFETEKAKKYQKMKIELDKIDTFEYLLAENGIGKEFCGSFDTGEVIDTVEEYDDDIGKFLVDVTAECGLNRITFSDNNEDYILTDTQLSELQEDIEEYVKFRTLRFCRFLKEENKKYENDIF